MGCESCAGAVRGKSDASNYRKSSAETITVALVGNPNVGKSVIFNQLTGAHQIIGNWPGKTVGLLSGKLIFEGHDLDIIDLPGTYSISSDIGEEREVREFLLGRKPDLIINVVDSTFLERNLALTIELLMLGIPIVVCLNQIDRAEKQGLVIDSDNLEEELGVPVVPSSGLRGIGITDLLKIGLTSLGSDEEKIERRYHTPRIASQLDSVKEMLPRNAGYPPYWLAERLLVGDTEIEDNIYSATPAIRNKISEIRTALEREMEDGISSILLSDRFAVAATIASRASQYSGKQEVTREEKLHNLLTHRVFGLLILIGLSISVFYALFTFGDFFATMMIDASESFRPDFIGRFGDPDFGEFIWSGLIGGTVSVLSIALPYLIPFFILLAVLEDTGYIARVAFIMDSILHRIGLHGKAFIPMILGYSCNVPACMGCRIMETDRERLLSIFAVTLVPCAATSIVILGLVGTYVGFVWVVALYAFNLVLIALLTRLAYSVLPGDPAGLIMEMPPLRRPSLEVVLKQSWHRVKDFIYIAIPLLIIVGLFLASLQYLDLLDYISDGMSPVTVTWLGLPAVTGIVLIFGILRKELTLLLLGTVALTSDLGEFMTDVQMIVFSLVVMLYIPCIATVGALVKEIGVKRATAITLFEIGFAVLVGGVAFRVLSGVM